MGIAKQKKGGGQESDNTRTVCAAHGTIKKHLLRVEAKSMVGWM
jgi:hypothetical protein